MKAENLLEKIKKIKEDCNCQNYDRENRYNGNARRGVSSNPNSPNYRDYDNELDQETMPDVTRNQNWATNPILNNKEDILFGCYALVEYAKCTKDLIVKVPSDFYQTPQFQDILNEFNQALNKALLNMAIAKDTADYFVKIVNPRD